MDSLRALSGRMVMTLALGYMALMALMWFLAPAVEGIAVALGAESGGGWRFKMFAGVIPYPSPFTARAALGVAIILLPPGAFSLLWIWSRKRA